MSKIRQPSAARAPLRAPSSTEVSSSKKENIAGDASLNSRYRPPTNLEQLEAIKKAGRKHRSENIGRPLRPDRRKEDRAYLARVGRYFGPRNAHRLAACNPWAGSLWELHLARAIEEVGDPPQWFVTLGDARWRLSPLMNMSGWKPKQRRDHIESEFARVRREAETFVRSRLRDVEFIFVIELGVHRRTGLLRGEELSLHLHGLAWGDRRTLERHKDSWPEGVFGMPGFDMKQIYDRDGLLPYVSKDERMVGVVSPLTKRLERRYRDKNGNYHFSEVMTLKQRLAVLRVLARKSKPELVFASGRGSEVLRAAKRRAASSGWRPLRS